MRKTTSGVRIDLDVACIDPSDGPVASVRNGFVGAVEVQVCREEAIGDQLAVA